MIEMVFLRSPTRNKEIELFQMIEKKNYIL